MKWAICAHTYLSTFLSGPVCWSTCQQGDKVDFFLFMWSAECQKAICNVKSLLCSAPVQTAPRFDHPLVLQVDASHVGAGAVLMQADEQGVDRAVRFFFSFKKFNGISLTTRCLRRRPCSILQSMWGLGWHSSGLHRPQPTDLSAHPAMPET